MKITSTAMSMQSGHFSMLRTQESESLTAWVGARPGSTATQAAPAASAAPPPVPPRRTSVVDGMLAHLALDTSAEDWRILLIKAFVEWLTGKPVDVFDPAKLANNGAASTPCPAPAASPSAAPATPPSAGFGIDYQYHASREEVEQTAFAAQGNVTTADGREIDFSLDLGMARSYSEQTDVRFQAGDAVRHDPLVINTGSSPAQLSTERMSFDLNNDGSAEQVPLLAGSAYLALDLNGNGKIDSGAELFGPATGSGFGELAKYDADRNGWIDENDPVFQQLRAWTPSATGEGSLATLKDRNVGALFLGHQATPFELRGPGNEDLGAVRSTGVYLTESGEAGSLQQIDLTA